MWALILATIASLHTAHADPRLDDLEAARATAGVHDCTATIAIGSRLQARDADYFEAIFVTDALIKRCYREEPGKELELALPIGGMVSSVALWGLAIASSSEEQAIGLSIVGGVVMFVAPSFGLISDGRILTRGLALRSVGVLVGLGSMAVWVAEFDGPSSPTAEKFELAGLLAGTALFIAGTVSDLVETARPGRARFVPVITPAGIAIAGRF